ncbi:PAS domain-containing sensor histidine kinase [Microcoleus sp. FACHB-672]|uniref:PAS domain-containing protein n=1 Tax=Microcoleus sp. FACHB-672 TaxID=2692825 RepID=UPI0016840283|nr:PAS domain-containing sensor histidine kinase [Microcoleus sp. FACHB-672]MBD2043413.1 PAS domain S-box protein [Microcoleus sp. FACHB-672]
MQQKMRKNREKKTKLFQEKALTQALLNFTTGSAIVVDPTGTIRALNKTAAQRIGKIPDELIGLSLYDLLPSDIAGTRKTKFDEAICTLLPLHFEDKSNNLYFENHINPVWDGLQLNALIVYERDITALKQAESVKAGSENATGQYYRAILDAQSATICRFLITGTLTFVNHACCEYFGKTSEQLLGENFFSLFPEKERVEIQQNLASLTEEKPHETLKFFASESNGNTRCQGWAIRGIFNPEGVPVEFQAVGEDRTAQVEAETTLREKQRLLERITEATPSIIYLYDLIEERNVYCNRAMFAKLGYTPAQIQAMGAAFLPNVMHPEDWAKVQINYEKFAEAKEGEIVEGEYRMRHANGEWRWFYSRDTVFARTADGCPHLLLGISEDITERKQTELDLRSSRQMLHLVIDNIPQAIFWKDRNSVYLGSNRLFAKDAGLDSVENIVGKTDYDFAWKKEEADFFREWDWQVMETDTPQYHMIETQLQADGKQAWLDTNKVPLHDASGKVIGILGTYEDITERKQMEEALQASEERFRLLVEGVKDYAIYLLDAQGYVSSWNTGAERIKGYYAHEIVGKHFSCFYEPKERQLGKPNQQLETCAATGRFESEGWRICKNGSRFWASATLSALRDEVGQLRGFAKVVRDITERKQAEEALQKTNEILGIKVEVQTTELRVVIEQLHQEIGQRTQAEAQAQKSQQKYRSVVDSLKEVIFQTDTAGAWTFLNPAWYEITGFSVEESLGKFFLDFVHPDDQQCQIELFQLLINGQKDYCRQEIRYLTKPNNNSHSGSIRGGISEAAGGYRWLEVFARLNTDDPDKFTGITGTLNDITERKQTEAALRESEERFRRAFEDVATGMALVGLDGSYLQVNRALSEMLGYSELELTATTSQALTHPADVPLCLEIHRNFETGQIYCQQVEKRYIHKNGHTVWAQLTKSLMYGAEGQPLYYVSQIQDITERKQVEAALRESEVFFRQLAENVDEVFWIVTPDFSQMLYVSPMYEQIWGRSCEQVYASPLSWLDAVHLEDREQLMPALAGSMAKLQSSQSSEIVLNQEYRIIRPDGSIRWIWDRSFPVRNAAGEVYRLCRVAKDITGRKQAEEELHKALAKEKELSELRSRFVTMVSHEFRTPLSTILSSADLLEYYCQEWPLEKTEKKLEHLVRIQTAAVNMTQLLNDVLVIGRNDAGKLPFHPTWVDLPTFCCDLIEEFQISADKLHIIEFVQVRPKLSHNIESVYRKFTEVLADEKLLRQILSNLLSNALKYSPKKGQITFKLACQQAQAIFQIQDNGIGIPPEDQQRLFEAFHRAKNVGDIPGSGLGLAIVKRAVDMHSGYITVKSEVGMGTTFTVALPLTNRSNFDEEDSSD